MIHATINAIRKILGNQMESDFWDPPGCWAQACDLTIRQEYGLKPAKWWPSSAAWSLLEGVDSGFPFPDCPGCRVMIDQALEYRASVLQKEADEVK